MAEEVSKDAKAIIKEIREQANTTRHKSENYSIKAIQKNLVRFEGIFQSMQEVFVGLDNRAAEQTEIAKRNAELAELDEDVRNQILRDEADRTKRENDLKNKELSLREKDLAKRERKDFKIFGKDGLFSNIFGGAFNMIKKAMFIGITGSFLYELTAGFLERFGIELPALSDVASKLGDVVTSTNWEQLKKNLSALGGKDVGAAISALTLGIVTTKGLETAGDIAQTLTLAKLLEMVTPRKGDVDAAGDEVGKSGRTRLSAVRIGIAGLVFSAMSVLVGPISDLIRSKLKMTKSELEAERYDAIDVAGLAIQGATVGAMLGGVKGAIIGALIGSTLGLGKMFVDYVNDDLMDMGSTYNVAEDRIEELNDAEEKLAAALKKEADLKEAALASGVELTEKQLELAGVGTARMLELQERVDTAKVALENSVAEVEATHAENIKGLDERVANARKRARGLESIPNRYTMVEGDDGTGYDIYTGETLTREQMIAAGGSEGRDGKIRLRRTSTFLNTFEKDAKRMMNTLTAVSRLRAEAEEQRINSLRALQNTGEASEVQILGPDGEPLVLKSDSALEAKVDKIAAAAFGSSPVILNMSADDNSVNSVTNAPRADVQSYESTEYGGSGYLDSAFAGAMLS